MKDGQTNVTETMRELMGDMIRMLITYEMKLTAYQLVIQAAQDRIIEAGIPWDMMSNVRKMLKSPALQAEAEAEYLPFFDILQRFSPQTLQIALASIKRKIQSHEDSVPHDSEYL